MYTEPNQSKYLRLTLPFKEIGAFNIFSSSHFEKTKTKKKALGKLFASLIEVDAILFYVSLVLDTMETDLA